MAFSSKVLSLIACLCFSLYVCDAASLKNKKKDPCAKKPDGKYCTRNSFEYMVCTNHVASYISCDNSIYDPGTQTCVAPSKVDATNYCRYRPNGDYNWPWNCHRYITCSNHYYYPFICSTPDLIFDPITDTCKHPSEVECKEIKESTIHKKKDPCAKKPDGKYCTRNSFEYMVCTNHVASYVSCNDNIYDPGTQTCVAPSKVDATNYCRYRPNGDYNWPWNCHKYITCSNNYYYPFNCSTPDLIFDPITDTCKHPSEVDCQEIKGNGEQNPCKGLPDGIHATRNVFQFLTCTQNKASYTQCPAHNIYDPLLKKCQPIANYNETNFCEHRSTSNWQNPWNCHTYIACVYKRSYLMKCRLTSLVYDPELDECVNAGESPCREEKKEMKSVVSPVHSNKFEKNETNPCKLKVDGKYATRDIFQYLQCTKNVATYVSCERKIFDPASKTCVDYSKVTMDNFCVGRPNSNYNNPWNCHKYMTCSNGYLYVFNCSVPELVYDPKSDTCKHPKEAVCRNITDPCAKKDDGKYATRDVFQYMVCKNGHATYVSCGNNVYDPCTETCVVPAKVTMKDVCKCRGNGNYMDPWDCHKYITCSNSMAYLFNCSIPELVYDPSIDRCQHPDKRECKQVKLNDIPTNNFKDDYIKFRPEGPSRRISKFCTDRDNGNWANPWNLNSWINCFNGITVVNRCDGNQFYNPFIDICQSVVY